jgi:hypothetical protein
LPRANTSAYFAVAPNGEGTKRFMPLTAGEDFEEEKLKKINSIFFEFSFNKNS